MNKGDGLFFRMKGIELMLKQSSCATRALVRLRFVSHLAAAQDRQSLGSALLPLFVLSSKLA